MEDKDYIKDLFSQKLGNYEAKVNPQLWDKIASQVTVGATAATSSVGVSLLTKWMIGLGVSAVVATTAVIISTQQSDELPPKNAQDVTVNNPQSEENVTPVSETVSEEGTNSALRGEDVVSGTVESRQVATNSPSDRRPASLPVLELPTTKLIDQDHLVDDKHLATPSDQLSTTNVGETNEGNNAEAETPGVSDPLPNDNLITEKDYWIEKMPDVFTPNNDGVNDEFVINSRGLLDFTIVILDKNSQAIFTSNDPNFRWSGQTRTGDPVADGKYVYFITAKDSKGNLIKEFSTLLVTRERR